MIKKIFCILAVVIMSFGICFGCLGNTPLPYNAVIIGKGGAPDWEIIPQKKGAFNGYFTDDFWEENRIGGIVYKNENWNPDDPEGEEYIFDENSPEFRTHIISCQQEYDSVFIDFYDIDFEKEMVLVYLTSGLGNETFVIKNIILEKKNLKVEYTTEWIKKGKPGWNDNTMPKRRYVVVKMDKLDIDNVEFCKI